MAMSEDLEKVSLAMNKVALEEVVPEAECVDAKKKKDVVGEEDDGGVKKKIEAPVAEEDDVDIDAKKKFEVVADTEKKIEVVASAEKEIEVVAGAEKKIEVVAEEECVDAKKKIEVVVDAEKKTVEIVAEDELVDAKKKIDRHCAFCLALVPGEEVKLCGGCKRRAYCSKGCQVADWRQPTEHPIWNGKIYGHGQGHKSWCGLSYGEEDLDWKVVPIEGKGLGIVALRDFAPLSKILVDPMQPIPVLADDGGYYPYHPGLEDLVSFDGDTTDLDELLLKFLMNAQGTVRFGPQVGLRIARVNHSCDANASCVDEEDFKNLILFATREIKEGEEICKAYICFKNSVSKRNNDDYYGKPAEHLRDILFNKWGIICPLSCPCRDFENEKRMKLCQELDLDCMKNFKRRNVLPKMEKIIETAEKLGCCPTIISTLYFFAAEYAQSRKATLKQGKEYLEMYLKFNQTVYHPKNVSQVKPAQIKLKEVKMLMNIGEDGDTDNDAE